MRLRTLFTLLSATLLTALAIPVIAQSATSIRPLYGSSWPVLLSALFALLGLYGLNWHRRYQDRQTLLKRSTPIKEDTPAWDSTLFSTLHAPEIVTLEKLPNKPTMYQYILKWVTNLSGSIRVFTYIPTILTLLATADSRSYSLLTWGAWVLANVSMTLSIYESNGRKIDHLVLVNICNTIGVLATMIVIIYLR